MSSELPGCAKCPYEPTTRICQQKDGKSPPFCPTVTKTHIIEKALEEVMKPENLEFARQASIQEGEGYADKELGYAQTRPLKPRIVEIIEFAKKMNYKKLGLVFCMGLRKEAKVVENLLSINGFDVVSGLCKMGRTPKEMIGVRDEQKIKIGCFESMCNPIAQAFVLNDENTEFNIMMGLCVGHDSLFLKYSEAPCTVFAVKDRLLGHNPLAAIYNIDSYYRSLKVAK
ncbi:MAG: DUF1847 domain-containing protein [Deltaproteobacteria bacterium]|nr:DUF1847 domain-containing protein [Deltaproteobacteria bacterium]MBW1960189.1 DUF1847 domain-containing protein [Deltaproteobacteria bacterium]MBW2152032.1 DUF1847 domain-containing protein [Deltaproteobacteria bacterium]